MDQAGHRVLQLHGLLSHISPAFPSFLLPKARWKPYWGQLEKSNPKPCPPIHTSSLFLSLSYSWLRGGQWPCWSRHSAANPIHNGTPPLSPSADLGGYLEWSTTLPGAAFPVLSSQHPQGISSQQQTTSLLGEQLAMETRASTELPGPRLSPGLSSPAFLQKCTIIPVT